MFAQIKIIYLSGIVFPFVSFQLNRVHCFIFSLFMLSCKYVLSQQRHSVINMIQEDTSQLHLTNSKEIPKPLTLYVEMGFGFPKSKIPIVSMVFK